MPDLTFILTTAGFNALVNPANTGTNAITIDRIGVTSTVLPGDPEDNVGLLALPAEIKRLPSFGGDVVGDNTIHVTIRDESVDVYQLRTFGLYSAGGVLLAFYTQPTPIMEKAASSMLLLAADLQFTTPIAAELVFGDTTFINPPATTETKGVVELATAAETVTGDDATRAVTPFGLKSLLTGLLAGFSQVGHAHAAGDITSGTFLVARIPDLAQAKIAGLEDALSGKAASAHTHILSEVVGLVAALGAKLAIADFTWQNLVGKPNVAINGQAAAFAGLTSNGSAVHTAATFSPASKIDQAPGSSWVEGRAIGMGVSTTSGSGAAVGGWARGYVVNGGSTDPNGVMFGGYGANAEPTYAYIGAGPSSGMHASLNTLRVHPTYAAWGDKPLWHSGNFAPGDKLSNNAFAGDWNVPDPSRGAFVVSAANAPIALTFAGIHLPLGPQHGAQFAGRNGTFYGRTLEAGVWETWRQFWHSGNFNPGDKAAAIHSHDWAQITGKPDLAIQARSAATYSLYMRNAAETTTWGRVYGEDGGIGFLNSAGGWQLRLTGQNATAAGMIGTHTIWTAGNFTPADKANLASPVFTGTPSAPTPAAGNNATTLANTAFVTRDFQKKVQIVTAEPAAGAGAPGDVWFVVAP